MSRLRFHAKVSLLAAPLVIGACNPGNATSEDSGYGTAKAESGATDIDRGPCSLTLGGFDFEFRKQRAFQGTNRGRHESEPQSKNKLNYGNHFDLAINVTKDGQVLEHKSAPIAPGEWFRSKIPIKFNDMQSKERYRATIDLNPEKNVYEIVLLLINESKKETLLKRGYCPNWDDPKPR